MLNHGTDDSSCFSTFLSRSTRPTSSKSSSTSAPRLLKASKSRYTAPSLLTIIITHNLSNSTSNNLILLVHQIIVITPPPVEEELWLKSSIARGRGGTSSNRLNHITKTYAAASRRVAEKCGVHCVDLYEAITSAAASGSGGKGKGKGDGEKEKETETEKGKEGEVKEGLGRYLNDGLHLSAEGNAVLVKRIKKLVRLKIPALDGDKLDFDFPNWSALFQ
jgi:hypothetical protein